MLGTSRVLCLIAPVLAVLALAACGRNSDAAPPTQDAHAIFTLAYETFAAEHATSAATTQPDSTSVAPTTPSSTDAASTLPAPSAACDNSAYVSDVTIPDGTPQAAGAVFVKTWRLQNSGTCPWTTAYELSFVGGDRMDGGDVPLVARVAPAALADLSVQLTAPAAAGTYTGQWQLRNAQQQLFGQVITVLISVGSPSECKRSSKTTITIMGHAGPENTTIDYGLGVTATDQHGDYAFQVPVGWSGTVTPSKARVNPWSFTPAFRTYSNVQCDLRNENFKAKAPPGV